ncbi:MAG: DUF424 family protein [Candidatus Parvarchaeota archaeon]|nr:DUF424 family protein [Candidatus Rehaiarchaeum fermentans]
MFYAKIHEGEGQKILAVCDKNLLGKTLISKDIKIFIDPKFYGEKIFDKREILTMISESSIINAFGNEIVKFLMEKGIVKNAKEFGGQLHAQVYKIL